MQKNVENQSLQKNVIKINKAKVFLFAPGCGHDLFIDDSAFSITLTSTKEA